MEPDLFLKQYNIDARINSEVISIDKKNKTIKVRRIDTDEEYTESYDKLILSPGASPIVPKFPGLENVNIFTVRNVVDIDRLNKYIKQMPAKNITVIGGGFIGIEVAENLSKAGYDV